ncbi:MAG: FHA domain-containing protein [Propionivibrio sp.]|jgi:pSer/pThr/pTyr-binding forkhead associated (FHA) protein|nr:FHA domain-containing protein [Propionivibrio sp.]
MIPPLILTYMSGPDDGRTEIISIDGDDATVTFGRLPECTISIASDPDASRRHARIFRRDGEWWLEDLGSANGTFIGEFALSRKIAAPVKLLVGQIFRIGLTRFRLENDDYQANHLKNVANITEGAA